MTKYHIEFSRDAKKDLISIVNYIKYNLQEPNIAKKLSIKIKKSIYNLADNPKIYPIIDDTFLKNLQLRKLIIDNYIVFYKILEKENKIQIVRIMYCRRDWINII